MSINRRNFNKFSLLGLGGLSTLPLIQHTNAADKPPLNILILGGTGFLGPHIVKAATDRGHTLTLFNRGKSANPYPNVESLKGNRGGKLKPLKGRQWDVVLDTSTFKPPEVTKSAQMLESSVGHYIYISSTSVYKDWTKPSLNEDSPTYKLGEKLNSFERYGAAKAGCEERVREFYPSNHTVIRPDPIIGPGEIKHFRYAYWVRRATMEQEILGPGNPDDKIQFIDVRDLAEWIVHCAEERVQGTYSASLPSAGYSMGELIGDCLKAAEKNTPVEWVTTDFLQQHGPMDFPFWSPYREILPSRGHLDVSRATANGLLRRDPLTTARDTLQWYHGLSEELKNKPVGVSLEQEKELLAKWRASSKTAASA
jgi:nucleoside-diphosphate-sugar epimerase